MELIQTPASIGDRLFAAIIDMVALLAYSIAATFVFANIIDSLRNAPDVVMIAFYVLLFLPVIIYFPGCEIFASGQTLGKMVMKTRVVMTDGSSPTVGSSLLRWLLYPVDTILTGFLGVAFIIFGKHRQRLGDLAAGTIVIKTTASQYDFNALYDYNYARIGYQPTYPEAANLTTQQVDVISRTLYSSDPNRRSDLIYKLALQVQQHLDIPVTGNVPADVFLSTMLNDFYYYCSTIQV